MTEREIMAMMIVLIGCVFVLLGVGIMYYGVSEVARVMKDVNR